MRGTMPQTLLSQEEYKKIPGFIKLLFPIPILYELFYLPTFFGNRIYLESRFWSRVLFALISVAVLCLIYHSGNVPEVVFWLFAWMLNNIVLLGLYSLVSLTKFISSQLGIVWKVASSLLLLSALIGIGTAFHYHQHLEVYVVVGAIVFAVWLMSVSYCNFSVEAEPALVDLLLGLYFRDSYVLEEPNYDASSSDAREKRSKWFQDKR